MPATTIPAESSSSGLIVPRNRNIMPYSISSLAVESLRSTGLDMLDTGIAASTWDTANVICEIPIIPEYDFLVKQMFIYNGATVGGLFDIAVFDSTGATKHVSTGATTQSGASVYQFVDVTDTYLPGGLQYWMTFGLDSNTSTTIRANPNTELSNFMGAKQMASGLSSGAVVTPLTFATYALGDIPVFGLCGSRFV